MTRGYQIDDEGDYFEYHLLEQGQKIGGGLVDIGQLDSDQAFGIALGICQTYVQAGGVWGGVRPI